MASRNSSIIPFQFESATVRTVTVDGEPWFVGKDVAEALCYANHNDAINLHCKGVAKRYPIQTAGGVQEMRVLSEPDVYRLIFGCTLPEAERFERWLFEEVLPAIRKTGRYNNPGVAPNAEVREAMALAKDAARLARAFGFTGNMIALSANALTVAKTGVDVLALIQLIDFFL